jgi:anti-sigma regulatory factor (Ser/Thr protein kinase)
MNLYRTNSLATIHEIELTNTLDELARLHDWLTELSAIYSFHPRTMFRADLVLSELVTNIIENAYRDDLPHSIAVQVRYRDHQVEIAIEDDGVHFNPFDREEFEGFTGLEEASIGGVGIHLARSYSDEYDYRRVGDKNRVTIIVHDRPA